MVRYTITWWKTSVAHRHPFSLEWLVVSVPLKIKSRQACWWKFTSWFSHLYGERGFPLLPNSLKALYEPFSDSSAVKAFRVCPPQDSTRPLFLLWTSILLTEVKYGSPLRDAFPEGLPSGRLFSLQCTLGLKAFSLMVLAAFRPSLERLQLSISRHQCVPCVWSLSLLEEFRGSLHVIPWRMNSTSLLTLHCLSYLKSWVFRYSLQPFCSSTSSVNEPDPTPSSHTLPASPRPYH